MRYSISGDKQSDQILLIVEGLVAGLSADDTEMKKEMVEFARLGGKSASLLVTCPGGVRQSVTIGGPVAIVIKGSKQTEMDPAYGKVALGFLCKSFLNNFKILVSSDRVSPSGIFQITVKNVPPGLGSFVHYDRRLTASLCAGVLSIPGTAGVEIGKGFALGNSRGSQVHDEIFHAEDKGFYRKTNNAGGLEGGMTNGEDIVLTVALGENKCLRKSSNKKICNSEESRFILGEAAVAYVLAGDFMQKFGGDSLEETARNYRGYLEQLKKF